MKFHSLTILHPVHGLAAQLSSSISLLLPHTAEGKFSSISNAPTLMSHSTCFIAMTYESPGSPAFEDPSNWRNVYTIPGDCPATTALNLDTVTTSNGYPSGPQCSSSNSNQTDCVHSYQILMPDELVDGSATFAWVWLSHLTTETYMNCAPVTISGAKNNGRFNSLPNLEGLSFTGLTGGGPPGGSSGTGSGVSPSMTVAIPTTLMKVYVDSTAVSGVSKAVVADSSGSSTSGICQDGTVPCSVSGFFCINETTFGECSFGCAVPMQMSAGTACLDDAIAYASPGKIRR